VLPEIVFETKGQMRSKQRVTDHGEVFTPDWMVEEMLDLVKARSERIDVRSWSPHAGEGTHLLLI
jgi:hypothetical protein